MRGRESTQISDNAGILVNDGTPPAELRRPAPDPVLGNSLDHRRVHRCHGHRVLLHELRCWNCRDDRLGDHDRRDSHGDLGEQQEPQVPEKGEEGVPATAGRAVVQGLAAEQYIFPHRPEREVQLLPVPFPRPVYPVEQGRHTRYQGHEGEPPEVQRCIQGGRDEDMRDTLYPYRIQGTEGLPYYQARMQLLDP